MSEPIEIPEVIPPLTTSKSEQNVSTYNLPKVTTSMSEEYINACALSSSRATTDDPLNLVFTAEKLPPLPDEPILTGNARTSIAVLKARMKDQTIEEIQQTIYKYCLIRLHYKVQSNGAFIAEAANFSAVTIWEPMYAPMPEEVDDYSDVNPSDPAYAWEAIQKSTSIYQDMTLQEVAKQRPAFADFGVKINAAKAKHLYPVLWKNLSSTTSSTTNSTASSSTEELQSNDKRLLFWHLCMTSRDPTKPPVKGAVRAVIEPFVKRFTEEDGVAAVWLEAGSARARDVYSWFGFRVVEKVVVGADENNEGVPTWCMIYTKQS